MFACAHSCTILSYSFCTHWRSATNQAKKLASNRNLCPFCSCAILSAYLYRLTRKFRRIAIETCTTQEHSRCCCTSKHTVSHAAWRLRALLFIFSTTVWTLLCFVPYRLFNLARFMLEGHPFGEFCGFMHQAYYYTSWASLFLLMLNPV
mgnify:CR=1 FL=1